MINRFSIVVFLLAGVFSIRSVLAQEAVTEKPATETEETPAEEATPSEKPAKLAKGLQRMMSHDEFTAAGLDKLSPAELEYLNSWLQNYRRTAEKKAADNAAAHATEQVRAETEHVKAETTKKVHVSLFSAGEPIVSRVNGAMGPLTGHTIVALEDGTKWRQANGEDHYRPRVIDHPVALVTHTSFGFKMRIEGMPDFYVNPVHEEQR